MFEAVKSHQRAGKDCSTLDIFHCAVRLCSIQVQSKTNKQKKMKKTKKCPTLEAKPKENLLILGHFNVGTIYFVSKHLLCLKNPNPNPHHTTSLHTEKFQRVKAVALSTMHTMRTGGLQTCLAVVWNVLPRTSAEVHLVDFLTSGEPTWLVYNTLTW